MTPGDVVEFDLVSTAGGRTAAHHITVVQAAIMRKYRGVTEYHRSSGFAWLSTASGVDVIVPKEVLGDAGIDYLVIGQRVAFSAVKTTSRDQVHALTLELL